MTNVDFSIEIFDGADFDSDVFSELVDGDRMGLDLELCTLDLGLPDLVPYALISLPSSSQFAISSLLPYHFL